MQSLNNVLRWVTCFVLVSAPAVSAQSVAEAITREAVMASRGPAGRPLPLVATWNVGVGGDGYTLAFQLDKIDDGHYILPTILLPSIPSEHQDEQQPVEGWKRLVELGLPLTLRSTQWEQILLQREEYKSLPPETNPAAFSNDGKPLALLDQFSPSLNPYRDAGTLWGGTPGLARLQDEFPDAPRVLFLSNNEAPRVKIRNIETSERFAELRSKQGLSVEEFLNRRCDDAARNAGSVPMGALIAGFRDELTSWRAPSTFLGFNSFGPRFYGRWYEWRAYAGATPNWLGCHQYIWGGASNDYYLDDWSPIRDDRGWSVQVEAQNWVFMLEEALAHNNDFWFELSIWDGNEKKRAALSDNIPFDEARYAAAAKFGLWLLRPRVIRDFRAAFEPRAKNETYYQALLDAVGQIHNNLTLKRFWRKASLVPNRSRHHFYNAFELPKYRDVDRWFILEASSNERHAWNAATPVQVFALALATGEKPDREWLLYAHGPMGARDGVAIEIPGYESVTVDVPVGGTYFLVSEKKSTVERISTN